MAKAMKHTDVQNMMTAFAEAGVVDLDKPLRTLVESAASALPRGGEELSLHVLCCNEYFLVTGLTEAPIERVRAVAAEIGESLS